jgi:OmpA family
MQEVAATAAALGNGLAGQGHVVVNGILFDTAKADVKPESAPALQEIAKLLQQDPKLKVYVVGHTDSVGVLAANLDLSRRRLQLCRCSPRNIMSAPTASRRSEQVRMHPWLRTTRKTDAL